MYSRKLLRVRGTILGDGIFNCMQILERQLAFSLGTFLKVCKGETKSNVTTVYEFGFYPRILGFIIFFSILTSPST